MIQKYWLSIICIVTIDSTLQTFACMAHNLEYWEMMFLIFYNVSKNISNFKIYQLQNSITMSGEISNSCFEALGLSLGSIKITTE